MTQTRTIKASADDRRFVRHITFRSIARPGIIGTVTGLPITDNDSVLIIRMYSAGCLHEEYTIDKNRYEIIDRIAL